MVLIQLCYTKMGPRFREDDAHLSVVFNQTFGAKKSHFHPLAASISFNFGSSLSNRFSVMISWVRNTPL